MCDITKGGFIMKPFIIFLLLVITSFTSFNSFNAFAQEEEEQCQRASWHIRQRKQTIAIIRITVCGGTIVEASNDGGAYFTTKNHFLIKVKYKFKHFSVTVDQFRIDQMPEGVNIITLREPTDYLFPPK